jgi:hypothetical protein
MLIAIFYRPYSRTSAHIKDVLGFIIGVVRRREPKSPIERSAKQFMLQV